MFVLKVLSHWSLCRIVSAWMFVLEKRVRGGVRRTLRAQQCR